MHTVEPGKVVLSIKVSIIRFIINFAYSNADANVKQQKKTYLYFNLDLVCVCVCVRSVHERSMQ